MINQRRSDNGFVCRHCQMAIDRLAITDQEPRKLSYQNSRIDLLSLYRYQDPLRHLILSAKADCNYRCLAYLCHLACTSPLTTEQMKWADFLMPAPSSLWGRLRGKLDIGYAITERIAQLHSKPLKLAAGKLHWRTQKRAKTRKKSASVNILVGFRPAHSETDCDMPSLLIVDDVITTGHTLRSTAAEEVGSSQVRFLTLSSAI